MLHQGDRQFDPSEITVSFCPLVSVAPDAPLICCDDVVATVNDDELMLDTLYKLEEPTAVGNVTVGGTVGE